MRIYMAINIYLREKLRPFKWPLLLGFILCLLQTPAQATPLLNGPRATMNYFLQSMKKYKMGQREGLGLAVHALDLSSFDPETKIKSGELAALRLIQTLDKIERIDINKIPLNAQKRWVYKDDYVTIDEEPHHVVIAIKEIAPNKWLFDKETLESIEYFERSLREQKNVSGVVGLKSWRNHLKKIMPHWMGSRTFLLLNGQWIGLIAILFLASLIQAFLRLYISRALGHIFQKAKVPLEIKKRINFNRPLGLMVVAGLWKALIPLLELSDNLLSALMRGGTIVFTIAAVITAHYLVDLISLYFERKALESENKFDDILVPLVRKTAKTIVITFGIVFIGNSLTLDMKSLIAGLGIGGLAFAFAAKDTLSNLFGSLTVLLDRPFRIGDWVLFNGIEGTVVEVGLRSTRLRTFYDSLITVPNGQLTNVHIDNLGERTYRRYTTKISIEYSTPTETIETFCEGIRQLILGYPTTRKDYFHVYLNGLGESGLDILLYVFWRVPDWPTELQERHRLLIDILRLGKQLGVGFAFPTRTLHLYQENKDT